MICEMCGLAAPTKCVAFHQNIGAIIMRFSRSAEGNFCKSCIHKTFWEFTLITLILGWWGMISLVVTPFYLLNNIVSYVFCLGLEPVPPNAERPELTEDAVDRLQPFANELIDRIAHGEEIDRVAERIALKAGVSQALVALFITALVVASQESSTSDYGALHNASRQLSQ